jgi:hypothetical protein
MLQLFLRPSSSQTGAGGVFSFKCVFFGVFVTGSGSGSSVSELIVLDGCDMINISLEVIDGLWKYS